MGTKTGRGWTGDLSAFGAWLKANGLERDAVAKQFDVTPAYVSMLAHGKATPAFRLARDITKWSRKGADAGTLSSAFDYDCWALS